MPNSPGQKTVDKVKIPRLPEPPVLTIANDDQLGRTPTKLFGTPNAIADLGVLSILGAKKRSRGVKAGGLINREDSAELDGTGCPLPGRKRPTDFPKVIPKVAGQKQKLTTGESTPIATLKQADVESLATLEIKPKFEASGALVRPKRQEAIPKEFFVAKAAAIEIKKEMFSVKPAVMSATVEKPKPKESNKYIGICEPGGRPESELACLQVVGTKPSQRATGYPGKLPEPPKIDLLENASKKVKGIDRSDVVKMELKVYEPPESKQVAFARREELAVKVDTSVERLQKTMAKMGEAPVMLTQPEILGKPSEARKQPPDLLNREADRDKKNFRLDVETTKTSIESTRSPKKRSNPRAEFTKAHDGGQRTSRPLDASVLKRKELSIPQLEEALQERPRPSKPEVGIVDAPKTVSKEAHQPLLQFLFSPKKQEAAGQTPKTEEPAPAAINQARSEVAKGEIPKEKPESLSKRTP